MSGARLEKPGGVFAGIREDFSGRERRRYRQIIRRSSMA